MLNVNSNLEFRTADYDDMDCLKCTTDLNFEVYFKLNFTIVALPLLFYSESTCRLFLFTIQYTITSKSSNKEYNYYL